MAAVSSFLLEVALAGVFFPFATLVLDFDGEEAAMNEECRCKTLGKGIHAKIKLHMNAKEETNHMKLVRKKFEEHSLLRVYKPLFGAMLSLLGYVFE